MPSNRDLWQRIQAFPLDAPGDEFPFSARLARENGWPPEWAGAAIDEYKKFVYLLCVTPAPLTPSEAVDQVWRLHLVYTRSYWIDFCEGVLGRPIHHGPTTGGGASASHVAGHYADTRSLYADEFECAPPAEFWPPVSERLAAAPRRQEAARRSGWIAPKRSGLGSILWSVGGSLLSVLASSEDLAAADQAGALRSGSLAPRLLLAGAVALTWLVARSPRRIPKDDAGKNSGIGDVRGRDRRDSYWGCGG